MNLRKRQIKKTREMKKMVEGKDVKIDEEKGTYLYCIVEGNANEDFGNIGIENSRVYTIFFKDVSAVVHSCKAEPYNSKDDVIVKGWILAHQNVVDKAMKKYGTVIPLGFDTIIKGDEKALKEWIEKDYSNIKNRFEKIRGKKEYGVQIFIDEKTISKELDGNEEIRKMKEKIGKMQKGAAYMLQKKMENMTKNAMENETKKMSDEFYEKIKNSSEAVRIEKNRDAEDRKMILNASVLLKNGNVKAFGAQLDEINKREGVSVRFVGPFAPYSFVSEGK